MSQPRPTITLRSIDVLTIGLFLAAILAPAVDQVVRDDAARGPTTELRLPAPRPATPVTWQDFSTYPAKYDAYFADAVGLRDVLLRWNSYEKLYLFDAAPTSTLVVGTDHWIFYTGEFSMETFRGARPFGPSEREGWQQQLEMRRDGLAKHGIRHLWVIVPNKETIYPEHMPASLNRIGPTRREQFLEYMRAHSTVDVLDLTDSMLAAKVEDTPGNYLYNEHGTHWAGRGALTAYRTILEYLSEHYPGLRAIPIESLEIHVGDGLKDTWSKSMYLSDVLLERDIEYVPRAGYHHTLLPDRFEARYTRRTVDERSSNVSALFFHDSFMPYVWDLMSEHFSHLCTRWGPFDRELIASETPNLVVEMFTERTLVNPEPPGPGSGPEHYEIPASFDQAPTTLFTLDDAQAARVEPLEGMPLRVGHDGTATTLTFSRATQRQAARFPAIPLPSQGNVFVRVEARADTATQLYLYWKRADAAEFKRSDYEVISVGPDVSQRTMDLKLPPGPVQFLLRPMAVGVDVTVRTFEVRTAQR